MDHGAHQGYPPTNGVPLHGLPPPGPPPPPHHEQHSQYMTPVMENHQTPYPPSQQQPMYPQHNYPGPISAGQFAVQRKKQMRATQVSATECRVLSVLMHRRLVNNAGKESRNAMKVRLVHFVKRTTSHVNIEIRHLQSIYYLSSGLRTG